MTRYNEEEQRQREQAFTSPPSAEVVHQPYRPTDQVVRQSPGQPLPASPTTAELVVKEKARVAKTAIIEVGDISHVVAEQHAVMREQYGEIDLEAFGHMLRLRREFVDEAADQIHSQRRYW
jgi:hypothetical protein